jgi:hypothetical protein
MTRPKLLLITLLAALAAVYPLRAQETETPPVPAPTPGVEIAQTGPAAQMTMDDGTGVTVKLRGKHSRPVLLRPGHKTTVVLQYDSARAGLVLDAMAMDGGTVTFPANRNFVGPGGNVVIQFSVAREPGLYRVLLDCGGILSTLQFWVPDPEGPGLDASVIVPQPLPAATVNSAE